MGQIRVVLIFNEDNERQKEIGEYLKSQKRCKTALITELVYAWLHKENGAVSSYNNVNVSVEELKQQLLLFDLEEPEVIKQEIIQRDLPDADMTEAEENTVDTSENKTKKIVRTLFPKQWQNHFGCSSEDVVLLHRVKYCGNWDVLRPAKIVEGMGLISENLLEKLNNEAHSMIEKMGCAV